MSVRIIAELSCSHRGSLEAAMALVADAKAAGADAIKLQTFTPDTMSMDSDHPAYRITEGPWAGRTLYDLYAEAQTPWPWHAPLFAEARRLGLDAFSTPYDATAVAFLETLDVPCYKVASFELPDVGLLRAIAATGKPVYLSTGMAGDDEIVRAVGALDRVPVTLLHCVSAYPTPPWAANLPRLRWMQERFHPLPIGISDHGTTSIASVAAVALGAVAVERHLRDRGGLDAEFSDDGFAFAGMVASIRAVEQCLIAPTEDVEAPSRAYRRRLVWNADLPMGHRVTPSDVRTARCAQGCSPHVAGVLRDVVLDAPVRRGDPVMR